MSNGATDPVGDGVDPDSPEFTYDEFAWFHENCAEYGLAWEGSATVRRVSASVRAGHDVSALRWGEGPPRAVLIHGAAQNAHTWDTVVLALRPLAALAVDLPGHGRSGWRDDGRYDPHANAESVIELMEAQVEGPVVLVGMSLGGLTATRVAAVRPDLVERLVVVDVTPGVDRDKAREVHDFIAGPQTFASFTEIFGRTVEFNPSRSASSLRRGILHNAHRLPDGSWEWNYHRRQVTGEGFPDLSLLWDDVSGTEMPYLLVRGADSPVTDDADVAELLRRRPDARVESVEGAGHSVQGDRPLELAEHLRHELGASAAEAGDGAG
jgi:pimeloyl-ACP methyl ester carboxylesterase